MDLLIGTTGNITNLWVKDVSPTGTFVCPSTLKREYGDSFIPSGWTVISLQDIIVSGAIVSGTNGDPNGIYSLINPEETGKARTWRNESGCWIIWESFSDEDDAGGFWSLRDVDPDEEMADMAPGQWIFTGEDQENGTAETPIDETWSWKYGQYSGYGDTLPTFKWSAKEFEITTNTWNDQTGS